VKNRTRVPHHPVDGYPRVARNFIERLTGSNSGLNFTGAQLTLQLDLQLAQPGPIPTHCCVNALVDREQELFAPRKFQQ
jgi:hypothetical protein